MTPCSEFRETIQDRLDGPVAADRAHALASHLHSCADCRAYDDGMHAVTDALRLLPDRPLPASALEAVWDRTIRAPRSADAGRIARPIWRAAAAAAILTAALVPALYRPVRRASPETDVARAREDARFVLALTARALRRSERAGDDVLSGEIAPAFRKVPIRWSRETTRDTRRQRS